MVGVLEPGSVVLAHYCDFTGEKKQGVFLVLYDEQLDSLHSYKGNVTALKVTTSLRMSSNYNVCISDGRNEFLDKDCFALCSKVHTLSKSDQIYKRVGVIHPATLRQVYKVYRRYEMELERQMEDYL